MKFIYFAGAHLQTSVHRLIRQPIACLAMIFAPFLVVHGAHAQPTQAGDFALLDHAGQFHQLSYYGDQRAVVIYTQDVSNNLSDSVRDDLGMLTRWQAVEAFADVQFFVLDPIVGESRTELAQAVSELGGDVPVLVDEAQLVAQSLGLTHLGEMLVIDPQSRQIVYRGGLQEQALTNLGKTDATLAADTPRELGPAITYVALEQHQQQVPSYSKDIAPILERNCVSCHHDGGIGPWAMSSHAMIQGWSPMMREVVLTRRMPPGQIDHHVGRPIADAAGLTPDEQQKLIHWIDAGAPIDAQGQQADPLAALTFSDSKFSFGEPDMVLKVPAQSIPATGVIDYRYVPVELNLDRDVWVRAMEFVPGDHKALHHVIAYLSSPADKTARGRATGAGRGDNVGGFAPGRPGEIFKDNSGRLITKGSNLLLQMHYTTYGKATVDETEVAIYLHDEPPAYIMAGGVAGQRRFLIPPHAKEHKLEGVQEIERDAYLYSMMPHMHYRGKYMSYTVEYPDGTSELILSVPKYDFNWQFNYELEEPLFLPAGSKLIARGAMDNSAQNPGNPDPTKPVHFGLQTKHEMFFGFTTLRYEGDTPESIIQQGFKTAQAAGD